MSVRANPGSYNGPTLGPDGLGYYASYPENKVYRFYYQTGETGATFFSTLNYPEMVSALDSAGTIYAAQTQAVGGSGSPGILYSINPTTMDYNWFFVTNDVKVNDWENNSPRVGPDQNIVIGSTSGGVWKINRNTGAPIWSRTLQHVRYSIPFTRDDTKVIVADGNFIRALNYLDGTTAWSYNCGSGAGAPGVAPDGTVLAGSQSGTVVALNPNTGAFMWSFTTLDRVLAAPAFDGAYAYFCGYDQRLYKFRVSDGQRPWTFDTGSQWNPQSPCVGHDGRVYFCNRTGEIFCISPAGQQIWRVSGFNASRSPISMGDDGTLYLGGLGVIVLRQKPAHITGRVVFNDFYLENGPPTSATVLLRYAGSGTTLTSATVPLDVNGNFVADLVPPFNSQQGINGMFSVSIKVSHWLRRTLTVSLATTEATGLVFNLVNGDISGDNDIDIGDYSQLSAAYGSSPGSANWNPNADLNGDGEVEIGDYAILSRNYGQAGDN